MKAKRIGVLTAGGDSPGLNAAIRAVGKAALGSYGMQLIGFHDGFRGLLEGRQMALDRNALGGLLIVGGTILGTSRDKPHRMEVRGEMRDVTGEIVRSYLRQKLDALICIGGGGTQQHALRLAQQGLNVVTLPKTIDNDVAMTDVTLGFDTALSTATEALDKLHSTADSHHRVVVAEIMGHRAGWLALGAGVAGGADVILIPEIPYDLEKVAEAIRRRSRQGARFSIVAVAESAMSKDVMPEYWAAEDRKRKAGTELEREKAKATLQEIRMSHAGHSWRLAKRLEELTGHESRVTILGDVQRGGAPSAADRLLATRLGTACAELVHEKAFGMMAAVRGEGIQAVPLKDVAGKRRVVPLDHPWILAARQVATSLGD